MLSFHIVLRFRCMTGIILLAGMSKRMGKNKLLLPYEGKTICERTLTTLLECFSSVIAITGYERERIEEILYKYPGVEVAFNERFEEGQKTSIQKGLKASEDDVAIVAGDLPLLKASDIEKGMSMLEKYQSVRAYYNESPGHPVFIRKELVPFLLSTEKSIFDALREKETARYQAGIGTVFDIDTPERYKALLDGDVSIHD